MISSQKLGKIKTVREQIKLQTHRIGNLKKDILCIHREDPLSSNPSSLKEENLTLGPNHFQKTLNNNTKVKQSLELGPPKESLLTTYLNLDKIFIRNHITLRRSLTISNQERPSSMTLSIAQNNMSQGSSRDRTMVSSLNTKKMTTGDRNSLRESRLLQGEKEPLLQE